MSSVEDFSPKGSYLFSSINKVFAMQVVSLDVSFDALVLVLVCCHNQETYPLFRNTKTFLSYVCLKRGFWGDNILTQGCAEGPYWLRFRLSFLYSFHACLILFQLYISHNLFMGLIVFNLVNDFARLLYFSLTLINAFQDRLCSSFII